MLLRTISFSMLFVLLGCDQLAPDKDKETKARMVGHWLLEYDRRYDAAFVREHIVHTADGKFVLERMLVMKDGTITREHESGSWFITADLYKMRTEYIEREPLPPSRQLYSTCKIKQLSAEELVCANDVDQWTKHQRRVPDNFAL